MKILKDCSKCQRKVVILSVLYVILNGQEQP